MSYTKIVCECGYVYFVEGNSSGEYKCPDCGRLSDIFGSAVDGHITPGHHSGEYAIYEEELC